MDILDDMGVSKLSAKVFFKCEPLISHCSLHSIFCCEVSTILW